MGTLSRRLFSLATDEVRFDRRGFRGGQRPGVRERIEKVGLSFLAGYHAALATSTNDQLADRLGQVELAYQGFAFEGAAMSLALVDALCPWPRQRLSEFLAGPGNDHLYMSYIGAGWAIARLPLATGRVWRQLDPPFSWLALDGYGFHQGFFHWPQTVVGPQQVPRRVRGYGQRAFDQGLGRSLWFVDGADVARIPATIAAFPLARRADMWAGIGLSASYAGGVPREDLLALRESALGFQAELAQGAVFAAKARQRAKNPTPHTDLACQVFCGLAADDAAAVLDAAERDLPADTPQVPAFEVWRQRIQAHFTHSHSAPALTTS